MTYRKQNKGNDTCQLQFGCSVAVLKKLHGVGTKPHAAKRRRYHSNIFTIHIHKRMSSPPHRAAIWLMVQRYIQFHNVLIVRLRFLPVFLIMRSQVITELWNLIRSYKVCLQVLMHTFIGFVVVVVRIKIMHFWNLNKRSHDSRLIPRFLKGPEILTRHANSIDKIGNNLHA